VELPIPLGWILVSVLALSVATALFAFRSGDRRRRRAHGRTGPRPSPSIGEALAHVAGTEAGRVLVVFLPDGEADAATEVARALAEEEAVQAALARPDLRHVVVRADREVADHLYRKYTHEALPTGPACLLLDAQGVTIRTAVAAERGPLATWLPAWVTPAGAPSRAGSAAPEPADADAAGDAGEPTDGGSQAPA